MYLLRFFLIVALGCISSSMVAQQRPKLVVGLIVDQMRWDYLYRFQQRWHAKGGFRRLLENGLVCNNVHINYLPSYTACGHAAIFTGSVPAIHGITGNSWWDPNKDRFVYCTKDDSVQTVGNTGDAGHMSPVNLLTTTIADELRLATNFRGKTIGIALKDRGGILSVGHSANAAYWYDGDTGQWITSTWYMKELPKWVATFNVKDKVDSFYRKGWDLLYPKQTYVQSSPERKPYEVRTFGTSQRQMPYYLERFENVSYDIVTTTPYGNIMTTEFAKAAIVHEELGSDSIPDLLAISFSSPDYIGHAYGPNSIELEDAYLRLDLELGKFLDFLDQQVGKDAYLLFLSSDHGISHVPGFLNENHLPGGHIKIQVFKDELNALLQEKYGIPDLIKSIMNDQVLINVLPIEKNKKLSKEMVFADVMAYLQKQEGIARVFLLNGLTESSLPSAIRNSISNSYFPGRTGHIQMIFKPGFIEGFTRGGTTHSTGYTYDTHNPLIFLGKGIVPMQTNKMYYITDIAPTLAALLRIQEPNGNIGNIITEVFGY